MTPCYDDLLLVNTRGNAFPYKTEVGDDWTPWGDEKDCDSFMSWKHWQLFHKYNWSETSLRAATCFVEPFRLPDGNWATKAQRYHAVLLATINGKTYVLDNRHPLPMEHDLLPYEWHKMWNHELNDWAWAINADRSLG